MFYVPVQYLNCQPKMGNSQQKKIQVPIIKQSMQEEHEAYNYSAIEQNPLFECKFYESFKTFLEKQILKKIIYIIVEDKQRPLLKQEAISEKANPKKNEQGNLSLKTCQNRDQLARMLAGDYQDDYHLTAKQKLIAYVKKNSISKFKIYLYTKDSRDVKIPDYEAPYIAFVASDMLAIIEHIEKTLKSTEIPNLKFRRFMRDLYRRTVAVLYIGPNQHQNLQQDGGISREIPLLEADLVKQSNKQKIQVEWLVKNLKKQFIPYDIIQEIHKLKKMFETKYAEYIIINDPKRLKKAVNLRRKNLNLEFKIIFFGESLIYNEEKGESDENPKDYEIWYWIKEPINFQEQKCQIKLFEDMNKCLDRAIDQPDILSRNTLIFTKNAFTPQEESEAIKELKKGIANKDGKQEPWVSQLNLQIIHMEKNVDNLDELQKAIISSEYTFLITWGFSEADFSYIHYLLSKKKLDQRVYMKFMDSGRKKPEEQQKQQNLVIFVEQVIFQKVDFKIKFEIGPLESITIYENPIGGKRSELIKDLIQYLQNKICFKIVKIESEKDFNEQYLEQNKIRKKSIAGNHIICTKKDYQTLQQKIDRPYLSQIKVIIADTKENINQMYNLKYQKEPTQHDKVIFMHYVFQEIYECLSSTMIPYISYAYFKGDRQKKFTQANQVFKSHKDLYEQFSLKAQLASTNQIRKQIFGGTERKSNVIYSVIFRSFKDKTVERSANVEQTNKIRKIEENIEQTIDYYHSEFLKLYANMWKLDFVFVIAPKKGKSYKQNLVEGIKEGILLCLFKCKHYELIKVENDMYFKAFYVDQVQSCKSYLDLQIACMFMFSLPHGLSKTIGEIFANPLQTRFAIKIFVPLVVTLSSAFMCLEDELMEQQKLVVGVLQEKELQMFRNMKGGEIVYNVKFLLCGKEKSAGADYHQICFQFQNIPSINFSKIKSYLNIEQFSFYKQSIQFLVCPLTRFEFVSIKSNQKGKYQVILKEKVKEKRFIEQILEANNIYVSTLGHQIQNHLNQQDKDQLRVNNSEFFYLKEEKKARDQSKKVMVASIKSQIKYQRYLYSMQERNYDYALQEINGKIRQTKGTNEIQNEQFKRMLQVQKAYAYFKMFQFGKCLDLIENVRTYLRNNQSTSDSEWVENKIQLFKDNIKKMAERRKNTLFSAVKIEKNALDLQKRQVFKWVAKPCEKYNQFGLVLDTSPESIFKTYPLLQVFNDEVDWNRKQHLYVLQQNVHEVVPNAEQKEQLGQKKEKKEKKEKKQWKQKNDDGEELNGQWNDESEKGLTESDRQKKVTQLLQWQVSFDGKEFRILQRNKYHKIKLMSLT